MMNDELEMESWALPISIGTHTHKERENENKNKMFDLYEKQGAHIFFAAAASLLKLEYILRCIGGWSNGGQTQ